MAGLAALMRSYDPELSVAEIKEAIMETAEDPFNNFVGKIAGNGRINAHAALTYAETRLGSGQPLVAFRQQEGVKQRNERNNGVSWGSMVARAEKKKV